jgi:hypothetical protein
MSYQPNTVVEPARSAAPAKVPGAGGIWLGVVLVVAGLAGAIVALLAQQRAYEGTVENLERALPGFRTELVFEKTGTFTLYYEYAGEFTTTLDGADQAVALSAPATPPDLSVRLIDQNGSDVRLLSSAPNVSYDTAGFEGVAYRQVSIDAEGRYTLEIVPDAAGSNFALAVGKGTVSEPTAVLPAIIAAVGVGLGLVVILVAASRRSRLRTAAAAEDVRIGTLGTEPFGARTYGDPSTGSGPPSSPPISPPMMVPPSSASGATVAGAPPSGPLAPPPSTWPSQPSAPPPPPVEPAVVAPLGWPPVSSPIPSPEAAPGPSAGTLPPPVAAPSADVDRPGTDGADAESATADDEHPGASGPASAPATWAAPKPPQS